MEAFAMLWLFAKILFWCLVAVCSFFGLLVIALIVLVAGLPEPADCDDDWPAVPAPDPDDVEKGA